MPKQRDYGWYYQAWYKKDLVLQVSKRKTKIPFISFYYLSASEIFMLRSNKTCSPYKNLAYPAVLIFPFVFPKLQSYSQKYQTWHDFLPFHFGMLWQQWIQSLWRHKCGKWSRVASRCRLHVLNGNVVGTCAWSSKLSAK